MAGRLLYVIKTGGKGWHGVFDCDADLATMTKTMNILARLGVDKNSLGRSATRVPGARRQPTEKTPGGAMQAIVWINPNL